MCDSNWQVQGASKLSWVVLDVVSDLESSGDPCEPLQRYAANYGIDHVMVTTREQIQESLGPLSASRKRFAGQSPRRRRPRRVQCRCVKWPRRGCGRVMCTPKLVSCSLLAS